MEIEAPYLVAIQAIAGETPSEKQRTINIIARKLAGFKHSANSSGDPGTPDPDVPEPLKPLVRVEVAKLQRSYEGIIEALKSEDIVVVARAIQATWFFDGSNRTVINAPYFLENVFPQISFYARLRVIRSFGIHLKNTKVAAEFFVTVAEQYGVSQAVPLLAACEEKFTWKMIIEKNIVLPFKAAETLYRKYPDLVINYLKLCKPDDNDTRNLRNINIGDYKNFLPEIANKRLDDFIEIFNMFENLNVKLGKKATSIFVKTRLNLLVEQPKRYLKIVSLKIISQKLSSDDFVKMFKNVFPPDMDNFCYSDVISILKYYKPEQDKVSLILDAFRSVYGKDLLSCQKLVTCYVMKFLPPADRIHMARLKLEEDKDWHLYNTEYSWRCYLPTGESIPMIKKEIIKCSDIYNRRQLLFQLIYTCRVNDDKDAFLSVVNYIYDKHRNDQKYTFYGCVKKFLKWFDLAELQSQHWEVLNKYIKLAEMQDDFSQESSTLERLLQSALRYCALNQLSVDDYIRILIDTKMKNRYQNWNILEKYPLLEKHFLDLIIKTIPKLYPFDDKIWMDWGFSIVDSLASALWKYNNHIKESNGKLKKFSIKDYPWILKRIEDGVLTDKNSENVGSTQNILLLVKENEPDLYNDWIRGLPNFWMFDMRITCDVLLKHHERVLENWRECLDSAQKVCSSTKWLPFFVKRSQWYQSLPINIFGESLKSYDDPIKCDDSIAALALLSDGETFAKIVEPYLPTDYKMDVDDPDAKSTYKIVCAITSNLRKVNPPVPLDLIGQFCVGDYLQIAIRSLVSVCCRVPIDKVIPFATILTKRRVSVMKHGIRLMYLVASFDEIFPFLTDLWDDKSHPSVRAVVFHKIHNVFCKQPDPRTWSMLKTCTATLNVNDDLEVFSKLPDLSKVPNQYLEEYITTVLSTMKSVEKKSDVPETYVDLACQLVGNIDRSITKILPEDFSQNLIRQYLFVFDYNLNIFHTGLSFTIGSYLLASKDYNELRFKFFGDFFRQTVKQYWNKTYPKSFKFYPINYMIYNFFCSFLGRTTDKGYDVKIFESLLEIFNSVLKPYEDAASYLDIVFSIEYNSSETSVDFGTKIAQKIPEIVEILSPEYIIPLSNKLSSFITSRKFNNTESSEEKMMAIIEAFVQRGGIQCALIAANFLSHTTPKKLDERLKAVIHALREFRHPGISGILNESLVNLNYFVYRGMFE
ncbi:uncharacterized protein LOC124405432 [Diprion similis]|uniref:uncharacterized protein LOC124405432 n=1 Tax=Diprion similis TaxID=362088 RepID=UPI001EF92CCD|nr:uncharacterized protein LOC124405432 [Diprion similis]